MTEPFFDITIVASSDKEWLWWPIKILHNEIKQTYNTLKFHTYKEKSLN